MNTEKYCGSYRNGLFTLFGRFFTGVFIVGIGIATSAGATGMPLHRPTRAGAKSHLPPNGCHAQTESIIHTLENSKQRLTPQESFRLAVLRGESSLVTKLHNTFPPPALTHSVWGDRKERVETLQAGLGDAALTNQPAMITRLVKYGAKPNVLTMWARQPAIMVAAECGNVAAMNALYKLGSYVWLRARSVPSNTASNAIEVAVQAHQNAAILWLLKHGAEVCRPSEARRIALFMKYPYGKQPLSDTARRALKCPQHK